MEFAISGTILPASRSVAGLRLAREMVADLVSDRSELSRHVEIARTWSQTGSQLICDQLASWSAASELLASRIVRDMANSITLSSSLAVR